MQLRATISPFSSARRNGVRRGLLPLALLLLGGCVVSAEPAQPLPFQQERVLEQALRVQPGAKLLIENLAGSILVLPTDGDRVELRATVRAGGRDEAEAVRLADAISLELGEVDGGPRLRVVYPVGDNDRYYYRRPGEMGIVAMFGGSSSRAEYMGRRVTVSTSRRGDAADVHADLEIRVPANTTLDVFDVAGEINIEGVAAELGVDLHSGAIDAVDGSGSLRLDTGSGDVSVRRHEGDVVADTGSGDVSVEDVRGQVRVDTGSGRVDLTRVEAPFVGVDTGSGTVVLEDVSGSLDVDTGSGAVRGSGLRTGETVRIDTGSGSVRLAGDMSRALDVLIDTSSGSVRLLLDAHPESLRVEASTGSGDIDVSLPGIEVVRRDRDRFIGVLGSGEAARIRIDTGSGDIDVRVG